MIHQELSGEMGLDLALLINFKNARLEWKRVYVRKKTRKTPSLICIPKSSYPCYPCNPWFFSSDYGESNRLV